MNRLKKPIIIHFSLGIIYRYTVTLEDSDTLRLRYFTTWDTEEARKRGFGSLDYEGWYEIVLKRSGSSGVNSNNNGNKLNEPPVEISGTWTIESGRAVVSNDDDTIKLTYVPGRIGEVGVEITKNDNSYSDLYSLTLSGEYVAGYVEDFPGTGVLSLDYSVDDSPDSTAKFAFYGNTRFSYIGNGTYEKTQETIIIQFH